MTERPPPTAAGPSRATSNPQEPGASSSPGICGYNPYTAVYPTVTGSGRGQNLRDINGQHYFYQNGAGYASHSPVNHPYSQYGHGPQSSQYHIQRPSSDTGPAYSYVLPTSRSQAEDVSVQTEELPVDDYDRWDTVFKKFLVEARLTETSKAFESDFIVLSSEWESTGIYRALENLVERLQNLKNKKGDWRAKQAGQEDVEMLEVHGDAEGLNKRKLFYVSTRLAPGEVAHTPSTMIKSISHLLARNRSRNNASNRTEFLYTFNERRKQVDPSIELSSCARTDARPIDRDAQMKYDIAKNSDGPLSRTRVKRPAETDEAVDTRRVRSKVDNDMVSVKKEDEEGTASRYPALDDRLKNIESHFNVRYVPSPPRTLLARLKFLEDHITNLEKEYPPWAALWFNQPNRGWPPPPRTTPVIVPYELRYTKPSVATPEDESAPAPRTASPSPFPVTVKEEESVEGASIVPIRLKGKAKSTKKHSSLHRAVMEKLEVQKALEDYRSGT